MPEAGTALGQVSGAPYQGRKAGAKRGVQAFNERRVDAAQFTVPVRNQLIDALAAAMHDAAFDTTPIWGATTLNRVLSFRALFAVLAASWYNRADETAMNDRISMLEMGPVLLREIAEMRGLGQLAPALPVNGLAPLREKAFWLGLLRSFIEKTIHNAPFGVIVTLSDAPAAADDPRIVSLPLSSLLLLR